MSLVNEGFTVHTAGMAAPPSVAYLRRIPYFDALNEVTAAAFARELTVREYGAREQLFSMGDRTEGFFFLRSGKALIFRTGPSELGVHPTDTPTTGDRVRAPRHHQMSLMVDYIDATAATLRERGGVIWRVTAPGAAERVSEARARLLQWRMRHDDRTLTGHRVTRQGLVVRRDPRI